MTDRQTDGRADISDSRVTSAFKKMFFLKWGSKCQYGLERTGMGWCGSIGVSMGWYSLVWVGIAWYGLVWVGMGWYGLLWVGMGQQGLLQVGMGW